MPEGITIRGIPEACRNLEEFPKALVIGCFAKALSRAAGVFEEELRVTTPESDYSTSSEEYGHLLDNLGSIVTIDSDGRGGRAVVSFGKKSMVALWVEFGHRLVSHSGKDSGKQAVANPFMRRAFENAASKAVEAFIEEVTNFMSSDRLRIAA